MRAGDGAGMAALDDVEGAWEALAVDRPSPFLTPAWLRAWWAAFGAGTPLVQTLAGPDGRLRAGAVLRQGRGSVLAAAADDHAGDWDVVAAGEADAARMWAQVAALGARRLRLPGLLDDARSAGPARTALRAAGYRLVEDRGPLSPYLDLPGSPEALHAAASRNLRSQLGRRRRALEREGRLVLRTTRGGGRLAADLRAVLHVEASGWKRRAGTAVLADPRATSLYTTFAAAAAERGWLRLHLLELDGEVVAADLACVLGGGEFLLKTGFDERWSRLSPGLVLRGAVLDAAIEEGSRFYDFLGGPDAYKLRWTEQVRPRVTLHAGRLPAAAPELLYRRVVRPQLKRARDRLRARFAG
jgi:CelD/BcsL family acetyltransferase involved in cellulose biosynthesis